MYHCRNAVRTVRSIAFLNYRCRFILKIMELTLNLLTTTIVAPPSNASKWQMGFNSAFKGLICELINYNCTSVVIFTGTVCHVT